MRLIRLRDHDDKGWSHSLMTEGLESLMNRSYIKELKRWLRNHRSICWSIRIYLYLHCNIIKNLNTLIDRTVTIRIKYEASSYWSSRRVMRFSIMIQTRQKTSIDSLDSSTFDSASMSGISSVVESTVMNETFDMFDVQMIEASEASNYAILQRELNQIEKKRRRVKLVRKMKQIRIVKIAEFFTKTIVTANRVLIDDLQKKKLFKIVNSKKYKSII